MLHRIIRSWYTGRWWVGCYIWYSEEEPGRLAALLSPLLAVPNVTAHPSTASVPITILLYDGPLLCGFNVANKRLKHPPTATEIQENIMWEIKMITDMSLSSLDAHLQPTYLCCHLPQRWRVGIITLYKCTWLKISQGNSADLQYWVMYWAVSA